MGNKLTLLMLIIILLSFHPTLFVHGSRSCEKDKICLLPNDYLKYFIVIFGSNTTNTYDFKNFVDSDNIKLSMTTVSGNGTITITQSVLNLKNNTITNDDGSQITFLFVAKTPFNLSNMAESPLNKQITDYHGFKRVTVGLHQANETKYFDLQIDTETGILLNFNATSKAQLFGQQMTIQAAYKLLDTNIITSSNDQSFKESVTPLIPVWIKNNAKWWSEGKIGDSDFVSGIQYLIKQGIMKIPQTKSTFNPSSQIPAWIKNNAGWWADDKISDNEFVAGIQYLISNGIMKI